jgi:hypothetical protein
MPLLRGKIMAKVRKGKKMNRRRVVDAMFRQMSKNFYTIGADCLLQEYTNAPVQPNWIHFDKYREWILTTPFTWNVWIACFCVNPETGEKYVKSSVCESSEPARVDQVQDQMTEQLDHMWNSCNARHRICRVWWATIWATDFEEMKGDMIEFMESKGAFDFDHCEAVFKLRKETGLVDGVAA